MAIRFRKSLGQMERSTQCLDQNQRNQNNSCCCLISKFLQVGALLPGLADLAEMNVRQRVFCCHLKDQPLESSSGLRQ
jgi:hypothetical protein